MSTICSVFIKKLFFVFKMTDIRRFHIRTRAILTNPYSLEEFGSKCESDCSIIGFSKWVDLHH